MNQKVSNNFCIKNESHLTNMSLQEAFETFRCDLINRSRLRQREIKFRAQKRQQEAELSRLQQESLLRCKLESQDKKKSILKKTSSMREPSVERRRMSFQEIKEQNKKLYEKLPEVKQKQMQQRIQEEKRLNRMKSSIFKKVFIYQSIFNFRNYSKKGCREICL